MLSGWVSKMSVAMSNMKVKVVIVVVRVIDEKKHDHQSQNLNKKNGTQRAQTPQKEILKFYTTVALRRSVKRCVIVQLRPDVALRHHLAATLATSCAIETESMSCGSEFLIMIRIMSKTYWVLSHVIICLALKFHQNRSISF